LAPLFSAFPYFSKVYEVEKGNSQSYREIQRKLGRFELIFCPHESLRSALFVRSIPAKIKVGFSNWWNFLIFTHRRPRLWKYPDAIRQLSLLSCLHPELQSEIDSYAHFDSGYQSGQLLKPVPEAVSIQLPNSKDRVQGSNKVAIFPGSVWATKKWTEEGFIALAQLLTASGKEVLWMGAKEEKEICERLQKALPQTVSVAGTLSLFQSLEAIKTCGLVVSNDSGGQHLAATIGVPTVSLFGPTVLSLGYRPWTSQAIVVENSYLTCRPCGKHGHQKCPIGTHECMKSISAQTVFQASQKLL
jgi:heptosyltransferase-2